MPASASIKTAHAAEKWLRRAIPASRVTDAVLGAVCASLSYQLGENAAVLIRRAYQAIKGTIEFVRLHDHRVGPADSSWWYPNGIFYMGNAKRGKSMSICSAGMSIVPEAIELGAGKRMWFMEKENMILSPAGINPRTGKLYDDAGCAVRAIWGSVHNGRKSYANIKTSLGIIENLARKTRGRNVGESGVFSSTINDYITGHGYRLDRVHRSENMSLKANRYALDNIYKNNPNCLVIIRMPDEDNCNHAFEVRNGLPVGYTPTDFYTARDINSVEAVSVPIWGGRWT